MVEAGHAPDIASVADRATAEAYLRATGDLSDAQIDLGEAALVLATFDRPRVKLKRYRDHLAHLAAETRAAHEQQPDPNLDGRVAALNKVMFEDNGYRGDTQTYDDMQNANLMRVIDRRKGLPVALGILYVHVARAQGWDAYGLNFPGHFLVMLESEGERAIIDPFRGGQTCDAADLRSLLKTAYDTDMELSPAHYARVENRQILLRLQNNIKLRLMQSRDYQGALDVVQRSLLFAPQEPELWREGGVLNASLGNLRAAIEALKIYLGLEINDAERHRAAALLQELQQKLS